MSGGVSSKPGFHAWFIFALSAFFLFYKYILQVSPSVMSGDLMHVYSLSGTGLGFLVGFYYYTYLIMQVPSGILLDKYGTHKLTTFAILLCACGALLFSLTDVFSVACFARLMIGFGAAFATVSYMKIASIWFPPQYFALLSGLFGSACMAGAGTAEAPLASLVNGVGWRHTVEYCAFAGFAIAALFWFFAKENKKDVVAQEESKFSLRGLMDLFRNRSNVLLIVYGGLSFTPILVFGGLWGVPYIMTAYGFTKASAASSVSMAFLGFAVGGVLFGLIGKQVKEYLPIIIMGTSLSFVFMSVVLYVPHLPFWLLDTSIFLFGLGTSSFLLSYAIVRNINSFALVGTAIGLVNMGDPLCGGISYPLVGKILDMNWDGLMVNHVRVFSAHAYQLGLSILPVYIFVSIVCCFFINEKKGVPVGLSLNAAVQEQV